MNQEKTVFQKYCLHCEFTHICGNDIDECPIGNWDWYDKQKQKDFVICPVCDGRRTIPSDKFKIWLVWDIFKPDWDVSLRAVCTDELTAKKYKKMIEKQHNKFNNTDKFIVEIEKTETNHCHGFLSLKRTGETPDMEK